MRHVPLELYEDVTARPLAIAGSGALLDQVARVSLTFSGPRPRVPPHGIGNLACPDEFHIEFYVLSIQLRAAILSHHRSLNRIVSALISTTLPLKDLGKSQGFALSSCLGETY